MQLLNDPLVFGQCLAEARAFSQTLVAIEADEDGVSWSAEFGNGIHVLIEWIPQPGRVVLSALTGLPAEGRELDVFKTCLSVNALWQESDGAKFALGGDEGELMFIRELHAETGGGWDLLTVLEHFAQVAAAWTLYITGPGEQMPPAFGTAAGIPA
jgi:hypothetical protein